MERILVVLPNWFGETLFATPFLKSLREENRSAFIVTLGWAQCREVLLHNPHVNELANYDERGVHRSLLGKWGLVDKLRHLRFDTAFILRRSLSRTILLILAGIPRRVGFANPKSGWLLTDRALMSSMPQHKAAGYLPLLEAVGGSPTFSGYEYTVSEEERKRASDWLGANLVQEGRPTVILHPGANWPHKRWLPERFAALADLLSQSHSAHILITGGPTDGELAGSVKRGMDNPAIVLAGRTTLRQLAAYLEQARLVVSNDTGVLHVAAALKRPIVGLYGPTSPAITGPLGDANRTTVIHHSDCCPQIPCYSPDRVPHAGMGAITVDEVYKAASEMLQRAEQGSDGVQ